MLLSQYRERACIGIASPPIGISTTKKLKFLNICRIFTFYGEYSIYNFIG